MDLTWGSVQISAVGGGALVNPSPVVAHRAPRPSPADVGVDQLRNKKLQIHAYARIKGYQCLQ